MDVIVPTLRCSIPVLHPAHQFGDPPAGFRCEGEELRTADGRRCPFCQLARLTDYTPLGDHRGALFCPNCYRVCAPREA